MKYFVDDDDYDDIYSESGLGIIPKQRTATALRPNPIRYSMSRFRVGEDVKVLPNGDFVHPIYAETMDGDESGLSGVWDTFTQGKNAVVGYISTQASVVSSRTQTAARRVYDKAGRVVSYAASVPGKVVRKADRAVSVVGRAARGTVSLAAQARNDVISAGGRVIRGTVNAAGQARNDVISAGGRVVRGASRTGAATFNAAGEVISNTAGGLASAGAAIGDALPSASSLGMFAGTALGTGTWIFLGIGLLVLVVVLKVV